MVAHRTQNSHYGTPGNSVTGEERAQIVAWISEGLPRSEIVTRSGRSGSTISGIAKTEGLQFQGRDRVKAATDARRIDMRARRSELSQALLEDAHRLHEQLFAPVMAFNFGGKDNTYNQRQLDEPIFADKLKIMQAAASAIGRHIDLEKHDADSQAADARSMLGELAKRLGVQRPDT